MFLLSGVQKDWCEEKTERLALNIIIPRGIWFILLAFDHERPFLSVTEHSAADARKLNSFPGTDNMGVSQRYVGGDGRNSMKLKIQD